MSQVKIQGDPAGTGIFTIASPNSNSNVTFTLPTTSGTVLTNAGPYTASSSATAGAVTIDASNNVGIGTGSPLGNLDVVSSANTVQRVRTTSGTQAAYTLYQNGDTGTTTGDGFYVGMDGTEVGYLWNYENQPVVFGTNSTERARITSAGYLLVGTTSNASNGMVAISYARGTTAGMRIQDTVGSGGTGVIADFYNSSGTSVGAITHNSTNTTYGTSSDYRLKENVQPMTGALARVAALKPCTYRWKATGADGEGFIAHELQAVVPDAVVGEKDAVNEDGSIKPQSIDTSFLVATLTAAIQEQQALINDLTTAVADLKTELAALKGAQ